MIKIFDDYFVLSSNHFTYAFKRLNIGYLEHLYYGEKVEVNSVEQCEIVFPSLYREAGNTVAYNQDSYKKSLEDSFLEASFYGKGDIFEPLVEITFEDGVMSNDFIYDHYEIVDHKRKIEGLPSAKTDAAELVIYLKERYYGIQLQLSYCVVDEVLTRNVKLINTTSSSIELNRMNSSLMDLKGCYKLTSFIGGWANEMNKRETWVNCGKHIISSFTGTSSSRNNPFFMLSKEDTEENEGICYGFNLIYSGNHYGCVETNIYEKTRVVQGINPTSFQFVLSAGESFQSPEAISSFSSEGFNQLSQHFHDFINHHIIDRKYYLKARPILVNSWEACYMDINEKKLLNLASQAKKCGIEMLVMDDGWFGERDDDYRSLGDWFVNEKKLPNGLNGLSQKVNDLGLQFGLWVEPEMINENSQLYQQHPDWTMQIKDHHHSEGRNQRILDLCNPQVKQFIIQKMSEIFSSCQLSYVKWDMNRIFSDIYSPYLGKRQKETMHRYYLALYEIMDALVQRFPDILFEGCSGGGNRFDLGILSYFPQIWGSDNTDAICRSRIQNGYSYGYPQSSYSCHVSVCPNHQTGRSTSYQNRFNIACFGNLGYELNPANLTEQEMNEICRQVKFYKENQQLFLYGTFTREVYDDCFIWRIQYQDKAYKLLISKDENHFYTSLSED